MRLRLLIALFFIGLILLPQVTGQDTQRITPGTYTGTIAEETTVVRYTFEATAGQQVTILMEATEDSELDANLSLFDSNGVLIQTDDDSAGNRNARIIAQIPVNGIYIIEASRYSLNPPLTTGDYQLTLTITGTGDGTLDPLSIPPDFSVPFTEIDLNNPLQAFFAPEQNLQYYVFGAQQGDFVRVEINSDDTLVANIRVLTRINQTLSDISRVTQDTPEQEVIFATIPQTGWYLIEVERESASGGYTLTPTIVSDTLLSAENPTQAEFTAEVDTLFFIFNATINERVFVNLSVLEGQNLETELTILDLSRNQLEQRTSTGAQVRVNVTAPRSSPYIVQVRNLGTGTGRIELQLRRIPVDISKLTINPADYNESYFGLINSDSPIEYYRFSGKAGELVTIEMESLVSSSSLDPYIILADSNLNELIFNDNASASRAARISQFSLPADGDYFILATRAGLSRGLTEGAYKIDITVGEIQLEAGPLTATLTWQGEANLNLFVRTPTGYTISWANPTTPDEGNLQIDSNDCDTPSAAPIEHVYWSDDDNLVPGDYTILVWYQDDCMMSGNTPFTLTVTYRNQVILTRTSGDSGRVSVDPGERFEASIRLTESNNAFVVNQGTITSPSPQQTESEGGDTLIVYGEPISGSITDEVFAQFYQFEGNAGDRVIIRVERITNNLDPIVVLRDSLDNNLAINDDISADNRNAEIDYILPEDGRYVISVTRYGVRDGTTTGNYTLTINRVEESSSDSEG